MGGERQGVKHLVVYVPDPVADITRRSKGGSPDRQKSDGERLKIDYWRGDGDLHSDLSGMVGEYVKRFGTSKEQPERGGSHARFVELVRADALLARRG